MTLDKIVLKNWNPEAAIGYTPKTTFYTDFSIADHFGRAAVLDTYKRAFNGWHRNVTYVTELVMVLNWKIWEHYESNPALADLYNRLWLDADEWCREHLTGDDLDYYYTTTD